jgi:hypothetical protein
MHFTYTSETRSDLNQGDVIKRTPAVEKLLEEVHPHYCKSPDYRFFIILTQSCDLVRRNNSPCKSRYISLAAVRPLKLVIEREIEKSQNDEVEKKLRICNKDKQYKLIQFMERLLNNNEDNYFFLYREPAVGLDEDHCAFLHLSIAVKSSLHYDTLLDARVLQLNESFQHKIGQLVGNLYSRVGTEDWVPNTCSKQQFSDICTKTINDPALVLWLDKEIYKPVLKQLLSMQNPDVDDLQDAIKTVAGTKQLRRGQVLSIISSVSEDVGIEPSLVGKISARLENNPEFRAAIK